MFREEPAFGWIDKHPNATEFVRLSFFPLIADFWRPGEYVAGSAYRRPRSITGFVYVASAAGLTGLLEPAWPRAVDETVIDGAITWTAKNDFSQAITALTSPAVASSQAGLTLGTPSIVDFMGDDDAVRFSIAGGTRDKDYLVGVTVTAGSETLVASLGVRVRIH